MTSEWFTGSKTGLEKIARRRGLAYVLFELVQNAWDTGAREIKVSFTPVEGRPLVEVRVEDDDPDGFKDLTHAWTLFAESEKKGDPLKRGRFNLGEKLVLAICEIASVTSTKGSVVFDAVGRHVSRTHTDRGTVFLGRVKMRRDELDEVLAASKKLIAPHGIRTTIDGELLKPRSALNEFEETLPTEVADEEGFLHVRPRRTLLRVFRAPPSEGFIYEMGIPVCPTGDQWDVDIQQKVPVNLERNSVSETYLRSVRVHVLNHMHGYILTQEEASSPLVQDALTDKRVYPAAVQAMMTRQYGDKRAVYDPSDVESNNRLVADGYTVVRGGAFSKAAWENIRDSGALVPSGQLRPTPKPYSSDPNAPARELLLPEEWTPGMHEIADYVSDVSLRLLKRRVEVTIDKGRMAGCAACYGHGELTFSLATLGHRWFDDGPSRDVNDLLIHELAHEFEGNHLSEAYYKALSKLGAGLVELALKEPELFKKYGWTP